MDRRRHPRFPVNTPVRLTTLLGEAVTADARLEQLSGAGARIVSPIALPAGTPLRLDLPDTLLLGECVHWELMGTVSPGSTSNTPWLPHELRG